MRQRTERNPDVHSEWLSQVDVDGPFLAYPVLKDMWPSGVDRLGDTDDRLLIFKQSFVRWERALDSYMEQPKTPESKAAYDVVRRAWIDVVLDDIAEWADLRSDADVSVRSPGEQINVTASGILEGRNGGPAALLLICEPTPGLRDAGLDGWAANDVDRLAMLLRKAQVQVGIVTDGQWWGVVWAKEGKPTGSGMVNALTWAEEPLLRDAFFTLINQRRFRAADAEQCLPRLFERSELEAEVITEALGTQVRRSVELLIQAFSEARLAAARAGDPDPLTPKPDDVYQAAVTVMMRIVFLLFAEERDMLPTEQLYWDSYAIKDLLDDLRGQGAGGEERLDETHDVWHRLLAVSQALHGGVNYDEMRMPAYGGSLLDADRFPWLHAGDGRGLRLKISDRVMLHVLESVQTVVVKGERRRISFREIDVEQIGYIYEGLLGYSCAEVTGDIILGLVGKDGDEPEIPLATINDLQDEHGHDSKEFAAALNTWVKDHQPSAIGKTTAALTKLVDKEPTSDERAELVRLLSPVAAGDSELLATLAGWGNLIRRDLRNIPLVIPAGGLVVVETPSRKNAGAHYTPRSLAEEVVLHALQPLVFEPGPLQTSDENEWRLKSASSILDLKVADIAAGSGAFLVAAARFLSERLVEAWIAEGTLDKAASPVAEELRARAMREVIAHCLYGADINAMAVEMCKLSLWLISMDKTKPFSFVDDKIFCGNSLLGLTSLDQLRYLHINPKPNMQLQLLIDIDARVAAATQVRRELANPVEERNPMRSSRAKSRLLEQFHQTTADLQLIADGVVAAGLPHGGKPGRQLDDAFKTLSWQLQQAFPADGSTGDATKLLERITAGLTPTVETDYDRWEPLHWVVAAPDVMVEHGGFDAVIGNPPFLVAKDISGSYGSNLREWLTNVIANGKKGKADLAAFFLLRASSLVRAQVGEVGLLLPKSVSEGDTRTVGLDQLLGEWTVRRSIRSWRWPSLRITVWIAQVWITLGKPSAQAVCDGESVAHISSSLEPAGGVAGQPVPLRHNVPAFKGSVLQGDGFAMTRQVAERMLETGRNGDVIRPYLNGSAAYSDPATWEETWVVDFRELPLAAAMKYADPWAWVDSRVRHEREQIDRRKYPRMVEQWWKHWNTRVEMYDRIRRRPRTWVLSAVSRHAAPVLVPTESVLSSALVVFDSDEPWLGGLLSSSVHKAWVARWGSTMQSDIRYAPSDLWVTFPVPDEIDKLNDSSRELLQARDAISSGRGLGITQALNLVDDPNVHDADIQRYREALRQVDLALLLLYGLELGADIHDHVAYRNVTRYWFTVASRSRVLDMLLAENHRRARAEGHDVPDQSSSNGQDTLFV